MNLKTTVCIDILNLGQTNYRCSSNRHLLTDRIILHTLTYSRFTEMIPTKSVAILTMFAIGTFAQSNHVKNFDPALPTKRRLRRRKLNNQEGKDPLTIKDDASVRDLQERCILEGALYGTYEGLSKNVGFLYQGVFSEGTSQTQIRLNIMPILEQEIVEGILPAFFDCPENEPTGSINGISPSDPDLLTSGSTYLLLSLAVLLL